VSHFLPRPEFFLDRSLGRQLVPAALRAAGWRLRTHAEVYGDRDETVADVEWLELCGRDELVVLSKDKRIRYRPAEIAAIRRFGVRAFVLVRGGLTADEQAGRFLANAEAIDAACEESGPFVHAVHSRRIERLFP
jgi:hypothetical protein